MKLRFRITAICLAAVLALGVVMSEPVYAADNLTDTNIEQTESVPEQDDESADVTDDDSMQSIPADVQDVDIVDSSANDSTQTTVVDEQNENITDSSADSMVQAASVEETDAIDSDSTTEDETVAPLPSLTITNTVLNVPEGQTVDDITYQIFLWDPTTTSTYKALVGSYGGLTFEETAVFSVDADSIGLPYDTDYGYKYYSAYGSYVGYAYYGVATVTLSANESITLTDLPEGCGYFIYQTACDTYYIRSVTDTVGSSNTLYGSVSVTSATGQNDVEYTNVYAPNSLRIEEETSGSDPACKVEEFTFTVYFYQKGSKSNTPLFADDNHVIEIDTFGIDGADAPNLGNTLTLKLTDEITLTGMSKSGTYNAVSFKLKHGQNVVFKNLGTNIGYYVAETPNRHYTMRQYKYRQIYTNGIYENYYASYDNWYIYIDKCTVSSYVGFLNSQVSVSITKQVENSDTTRDFYFIVNILQYTPDYGGFAPLTPGNYTLSYTGSKGNYTEEIYFGTDSEYCREAYPYIDYRTYTTAYSEWSAALIKVAAGQTVTIEGLPTGVTYYIAEVPVTNYTVSAKATNGTVKDNGDVYYYVLLDDAAITFTNTYTQPEGKDLTISKTVTGNMADTNREFSFEIALTDENDQPLSNQDIPVLLPDETTSIYTTNESGVLTVSLKHGQQLTLQDLPQNTKYTITETEASAYTTTFEVTGGSYDEPINQTQSGAIDGEGDVVVVKVTNEFVFVPTGINTDIQPYVLMLVLVLGFLLLLLCTRRLYRFALGKKR
jgi:hypothetical protein